MESMNALRHAIPIDQVIRRPGVIGATIAVAMAAWLLAVALFAAACSKPSEQWLTISEETSAYTMDPSTRSDLPAVSAVLAPRTRVRLLDSRQGKEWLVYRILTPAGDTAFVKHSRDMNIVTEP
jgi:hypothetical protein